MHCRGPLDSSLQPWLGERMEKAAYSIVDFGNIRGIFFQKITLVIFQYFSGISADVIFQRTSYAVIKIENNYHYYCPLKVPYARPLGLNLLMNSDDFAMFLTLWLSLVNLNTLAGKLQALESEHLHHIVHHSNRLNLEKETNKQ